MKILAKFFLYRQKLVEIYISESKFIILPMKEMSLTFRGIILLGNI